MKRISNHPYRYLIWDPKKRCAVEVEFAPPRRFSARPEGFDEQSTVRLDGIGRLEIASTESVRLARLSGGPSRHDIDQRDNDNNRPDAHLALTVGNEQPDHGDADRKHRNNRNHNPDQNGHAQPPASVDSSTSLDRWLARPGHLRQAVLAICALCWLYILHLGGWFG